nr:peptidylprolyl isomerase [Pseudoflavonifractor sp. An176]
MVYSAVAVVVCAALVGGTVAIAHFTSDEDPAATATPTTTDEDASATETATSDETTDTYTPAALESGVTYTAQIEVEDYGTITVELDQEAAPITCANFVELANSGFYNGLTFHRIIEGFMMQGGDPNGDGTGGSDNNIVGEFTNNGYENNLSHTRGAISMARSSDYNSASSQFFIVQEDSTNLDGDYAVFGYVTQGMDVVDAICEAAQPTDDNGTISAEDQPVITSITILTDQ